METIDCKPHRTIWESAGTKLTWDSRLMRVSINTNEKDVAVSMLQKLVVNLRIPDIKSIVYTDQKEPTISHMILGEGIAAFISDGAIGPREETPKSIKKRLKEFATANSAKKTTVKATKIRNPLDHPFPLKPQPILPDSKAIPEWSGLMETILDGNPKV